MPQSSLNNEKYVLRLEDGAYYMGTDDAHNFLTTEDIHQAERFDSRFEAIVMMAGAHNQTAAAHFFSHATPWPYKSPPTVEGPHDDDGEGAGL